MEGVVELGAIALRFIAGGVPSAGNSFKSAVVLGRNIIAYIHNLLICKARVKRFKWPTDDTEYSKKIASKAGDVVVDAVVPYQCL